MGRSPSLSSSPGMGEGREQESLSPGRCVFRGQILMQCLAGHPCSPLLWLVLLVPSLKGARWAWGTWCCPLTPRCPVCPAGNLDGEGGVAEHTVEDVFIRKFIYGTFHGCLANEIVLKHRANVLVVCAVFLQRLPPYKFYFLVGYTETLLSFLYKCPVQLEVQTLPERVIYKYL
ncbi:unnamed protein product [Caretta caretta]